MIHGVDYSKISISTDRTYHIYNGIELYPQRFIEVGRYHNPGLAPAKMKQGWCHIDAQGIPVYDMRFKKVFGFYESLAAVYDNLICYHIDVNGQRAYANSFKWVGNFQEGVCVVEDFENRFFHINRNGDALYENKYDYAGDFKEGISAVFDKNLGGTHISTNGQTLYQKWFKDVDVYHKGIAKACDMVGWFHIDKNGVELYQYRFQSVSDYYNDLAHVVDKYGNRYRIDTNGRLEDCIYESHGELHDLLSNFVSPWKIHVIFASLKIGLFDLLPDDISSLSKNAACTQENILRILRALWELNIVIPDGLLKWNLTPKGWYFKTMSGEFIKSAAEMWSDVAKLDWHKLDEVLMMSKIKSFPSFKELETNPEKLEIYRRALDGYILLDMEHIVNYCVEHFSLKDSISIIGWSAKTLGNHLEKIGYYVKPYEEIDLYAMNSHPQNEPLIILKYLMHYDDNLCEEIIYKLSNITSRILIIEPMFVIDKPIFGLLDLNMAIECGGKIRSVEDMAKILSKGKFNLVSFDNRNPNVTFLFAERVL